MNRDGARKSLWQQEVVTFKQPDVSDMYDVAIVGGGITGLSCAIRLQEVGKKCILLEAYNIGFGTTGGTTAHINTFFDASYDQVIRDFSLEEAQLLASGGREAMNDIKNNIAAYGIEAEYADRAAYIFALDDSQSKTLKKIRVASNEAGIKMEEVTSNPFPVPYVSIVKVPDQGQFHPLKYITGLAQAFVRRGGHIYDQCRVIKHEAIDDTLTIKTSRGHIRAKHLIYATHTAPGVNILHFRSAPYRSYAMALRLKGSYPQALGYDLSDPYHYYRTQTIDGEDYLIAGGEDHKTGHEADTGQCFSRLEEYVRQYFDVDVITHLWSSQYYEPADGLPYIGNLPGAAPHVYIATGYTGNGITFGTLAGRVLCDLIVTGESAYQKLFTPSRVKPVAAFSNVLKEGADVAAFFVKDKLFTKKLQSLSDLQPGEAKTIKYEGTLYAMYKDTRNRLHAVNSTCPHVYCNVHWNSAEMSWDCPCHGSRFKINGDVLNGPAVNGLERIDFEEEEE